MSTSRFKACAVEVLDRVAKPTRPPAFNDRAGGLVGCNPSRCKGRTVSNSPLWRTCPQWARRAGLSILIVAAKCDRRCRVLHGAAQPTSAAALRAAAARLFGTSPRSVWPGPGGGRRERPLHRLLAWRRSAVDSPCPARTTISATSSRLTAEASGRGDGWRGAATATAAPARRLSRCL